MQTVSCPSCGAPVQFKSHAAVMAVCEFCRASILKDGDAVKDVGKLSAVLEDYSPIQIGTAGSYAGRGFTVVGRIQLRYAQGMWNEWYLLYDDASAAWLGDASGQYTITTARPASGPLPSFDEIVPGNLYPIGSEHFTAADKREGECIGGQGELPFRVGDGWRIRAADLRCGAAFITLDYTDGAVPVVYNGKAVTLPELTCQLLRSDEEIKASAGRYRGKLDALDCPSCGSAISYLPGVTTSLVCPACSAQLDAAGPEARVLAAGAQVEAVISSLELGATASISGEQYTVIGAMVRADDEGATWTEYLLYGTKGGFFWLVETDEGWSRAQVLGDWPAWNTPAASSATLGQDRYEKLVDYEATVRYAAGAFNWRVTAGDKTRVYEFKKSQATLSAELSAEELTWSRSTPVANDQVLAWFGKSAKGVSAAPKQQAASNYSTQMKFVWWILGLNAIPLLANFGGTFTVLLLALFALFIPAPFFKNDGDDT
ncbi:DUF4178 domain-containing protein [Massilia sp. TSP1-1-2]|uniref:DUF4178 domain-containing protein n=1 Tax=Massilia sp. TSP1-1-2 TaxID=2804649 RepID=UPI003CF797FC